jgi:tripeptide aminopeptidase
MEENMSVLDRFLRYVKVNTPSDEKNDSVTPSNANEFKLANLLVDELKGMGIENAQVDENCYVYASIPANCDAQKAIGFIAHLDVVDEPKGYDVKPQVIHYEGGNITLPSGLVISAEKFPALNNYRGMDIVTSDGTTILGADDKAGVAEIMELAEYIVNHPEVPHGKIGIAFTPDEEIGMGASKFDVKKFGCDYAYTIDGEQIGELSYETFNGAAFTITITGENIHPGQAKGKMINALVVANQMLNAFPASERPETTEGREGYYFFNDMKATVEKCELSGIIRDHDKVKFEERKKYLQRVASVMQAEYPERVTLSMHDQYYNCAEIIKAHFHLVENATKAMKSVGVEPIIEPIRGGTDGSGLSFKGLPCPNICTGGHNAHGLSEFVPVQCMEKVVEILKGIVTLYGNFKTSN